MVSFHCTDHELQIIKLCIIDDIKISDEMEKGNEDGRGWESAPSLTLFNLFEMKF